MAKVGESNQMWIVDARADGKNTGNWHWTTKNLWRWCESRCKELFSEMIVNEEHQLKVYAVDTCKGDMSLMNRKGKVIHLYDWNMKLKWKGTWTENDGAETKVEGFVVVNDITDDETPVVKINTSKNTAAAKALVKEMQKVKPMILSSIDTILTEMKGKQEGLTFQAEKPPAPSAGTRSDSPVTSASASKASTSVASSSTTTTKKSRGKKNFTQSVKFGISPGEMYETFADQNRVSGFTGSPAKVGKAVGEDYSILGGVVTGKMLEVTPRSKLAWTWRHESWDPETFSQVTVTFKAEGGKALVIVNQTGIPEDDFQRTRDGWEQFFWKRINGLFGWPYNVVV
eukprot:TRINITY_DN975_c1_g1_i1.p1 TRINITY_DN975_c1_g1~~TRINITY_DN975_c1_g1_i1.p1  ORF type:complete len:369 (-),score=99.87 TRINITY_DN975_c1_g1_i1:111-1136(-)